MLYPEKIRRAETFQHLVQISSNILLESNPVMATSQGITLYNNLWPDISPHGVAKDIETLKSIRTKLQQLSPRTEEEDDYQLLEWFLEVNLHELEEIRLWESAHILSSLVLGGILDLVRKTHPDQTSRVESIIARLRSIVPLIKGEQRRISHSVSEWVNVEIRAIDKLQTYLQSLPEIFSSEHEELLDELHQSINFACSELDKHLDWLDTLEGGKLPVDKEAYKTLLEIRRIGFTVEELEQLGWDYLEYTQKELEKLTRPLGGSSIEEVRQEIRENHAPDFNTVIKYYRQLADRARDFLQSNNIVTVPDFKFEVITTPEPLREFLSIAAASMPGRFDKDQTAYFMCTPHDDLSMLEEHSFAYQPLLISHESFPGHNLHGAAKNTHPSKIRTAIFSHPSANTGLMYSSKLADITEGWGLYTEEMMWKAGFENDPEDPDLHQRFLQINAMRWRAARIIIDTQLHTGRMTFDEGVKFLMEKTGYHRTTARAELMMYSRSPGYFSSYLLGKHLLTNLRETTKYHLTDKEFHDAIIYAGNVPYWFIKEKIMKRVSIDS